MKIDFVIFSAIFSLGVSLSTGKSKIQQSIIQPNDNFNLTPVRDALISNRVIGDVLDDFEPSYYIDLVYPKHQTRVLLGNEIKPKYVQKRPSLTIEHIPTGIPAEDEDGLIGKTFTLVLTDPDAMSRYNPKWSEMCHWIVTNLTAPTSKLSSTLDLQLDLELDLTSKLEHTVFYNGPKDEPSYSEKSRSNKKRSSKNDKRLENELMSYFPPAPPPKTGFHRYVFVLLEGDATHLKAPQERKHWGYGKVRHGVRDWAAENGLTVVGANFFFALNKKQ